MSASATRTAITATTVAAIATACVSLAWLWRRRTRRREAMTSALDLIGNTPLVRINSLSEATGCEILAKCEFANPGGSSKDRVALAIVREAERSGRLKPGGTLVEATAGSTGISLALVAKACGYRCVLVTPDDTSPEKMRLIRALGAELEIVKPAGIANPDHPVNVARRLAASLGEGNALFCDQFENMANMRAHEATTGEEVWAQTDGAVDAFVMSAGTGGTIAGVSRVLKRRKPSCQIVLADPPGSALYFRVRHGVVYTSQQQERTALRHRYDTIMEGVGCDRVTSNFAAASIDDAYKVSDAESTAMAKHLLQRDGLFVGGSSAMNCVAAVKAARRLGPGSTIVTVLCDGGQRYLNSVHAAAASTSGGGAKSVEGDAIPPPPAAAAALCESTEPDDKAAEAGAAAAAAQQVGLEAAATAERGKAAEDEEAVGAEERKPVERPRKEKKVNEKTLRKQARKEERRLAAEATADADAASGAALAPTGG